MFTDQLINACQYAFEVHQIHRDQKRKGTQIPYIAHIFGAAGIALEHGATEDEVIAALLHDTIEDGNHQPAEETRREIREKFGPNVLAIVEGCTDADTHPKPPWKDRKEAYLEHLKSMPRSVQLVSAADKLNNARAIVSDCKAIGEKLWSRFSGGKDGTLWYYRSLVNTYKSSALIPKQLLQDLDDVVTEMERLTMKPPVTEQTG